MSGAIMPLPLMIAQMSRCFPPIMAVAVAPLANVSVVPMVRAASSHEHGSGGERGLDPGARLVLGQRHADHAGGGDEHFAPAGSRDSRRPAP
jgi:hypothetical protein